MLLHPYLILLPLEWEVIVVEEENTSFDGLLIFKLRDDCETSW